MTGAPAPAPFGGAHAPGSGHRDVILGANGQDFVTELDPAAELVLGEAVILDLRPASFASRGLSFLLDALLIVLTLGALGLAAGSVVTALGMSASAEAALSLVSAVTALVILPTVWETWSRGRSPGKAAAGLRVVRDDGGPIRMRQALVRSLIAVPEIWTTFGGIALITSLANSKGKRLGDLLAGTYVVRERVESRVERPPLMPPGLDGWAAGTDMRRIPDSLAMAARQLLNRVDRLHPQVRTSMATQIANQLSQYVAPSPPGYLDPETYISAVLAERHRREFARLARRHAENLARRQRRAQANPLSASSTRLL